MLDSIDYKQACYDLIKDNNILMEWLRIAIKNIESPDESEIIKLKKAYKAYYKIIYNDNN